MELPSFLDRRQLYNLILRATSMREIFNNDEAIVIAQAAMLYGTGFLGFVKPVGTTSTHPKHTSIDKNQNSNDDYAGVSEKKPQCAQPLAGAA